MLYQQEVNEWVYQCMNYDAQRRGFDELLEIERDYCQKIADAIGAFRVKSVIDFATNGALTLFVPNFAIGIDNNDKPIISRFGKVFIGLAAP